MRGARSEVGGPGQPVPPNPSGQTAWAGFGRLRTSLVSSVVSDAFKRNVLWVRLVLEFLGGREGLQFSRERFCPRARGGRARLTVSLADKPQVMVVGTVALSDTHGPSSAGVPVLTAQGEDVQLGHICTLCCKLTTTKPACQPL